MNGQRIRFCDVGSYDVVECPADRKGPAPGEFGWPDLREYAAAPVEALRCEERGRTLVPTADSGV